MAAFQANLSPNMLPTDKMRVFFLWANKRESPFFDTRQHRTSAIRSTTVCHIPFYTPFLSDSIFVRESICCVNICVTFFGRKEKLYNFSFCSPSIWDAFERHRRSSFPRFCVISFFLSVERRLSWRRCSHMCERDLWHVVRKPLTHFHHQLKKNSEKCHGIELWR